MFINTVLHKTSTVTITIGTLILCIGVLIYSEECSGGAIKGIEMCLSVLVPSLFPFMALSSFMVKSGINQTLGKPFKWIMQKIFGLDDCFAPVLLLTMIGGYPVGAKGISVLYESKIISDGLFKNCILCLLEVCAAVSTSAENSPIEMIAFASGFGGICVHFQIYSALGKLKVNRLSFFCIRIIQGSITALLTHLGLSMLKVEAMVFSTSTVEKASTSGGTIISGAVLVLVMLCFLYTLKNNKAN